MAGSDLNLFVTDFQCQSRQTLETHTRLANEPPVKMALTTLRNAFTTRGTISNSAGSEYQIRLQIIGSRCHTHLNDKSSDSTALHPGIHVDELDLKVLIYLDPVEEGPISRTELSLPHVELSEFHGTMAHTVRFLENIKTFAKYHPSFHQSRQGEPNTRADELYAKAATCIIESCRRSLEAGQGIVLDDVGDKDETTQWNGTERIAQLEDTVELRMRLLTRSHLYPEVWQRWAGRKTNADGIAYITVSVPST